MKIVLLNDVKNLGKKDEILDVNDGYAYNYLIPKKIAIPLNNDSQKYLDQKNKKIQAIRKEQLDKALYYQKKMQEITLFFAAKCSPDGNMIGTISHKQIKKKLEEFGILIDKNKILSEPVINQFGLTELKVILFQNVVGIIKIFVNKDN